MRATRAIPVHAQGPRAGTGRPLPGRPRTWAPGRGRPLLPGVHVPHPPPGPGGRPAPRGRAADPPLCPVPVPARRASHFRGRRGLHQEPALPPRPGLQVHFGGRGRWRHAAVGLIQLPAWHRLPGGHTQAGRPGPRSGHLGPQNLTIRLPRSRNRGRGRHPHRRGVQRPAPQPGHNLRPHRPGPGPALTGHNPSRLSLRRLEPVPVPQDQ